MDTKQNPQTSTKELILARLREQQDVVNTTLALSRDLKIDHQEFVG